MKKRARFSGHTWWRARNQGAYALPLFALMPALTVAGSSAAEATTIIYEEIVSGDLPEAPTAIPSFELSEGVNVLTGSGSSLADDDLWIGTLMSGHKINFVELEIMGSTGGVAHLAGVFELPAETLEQVALSSNGTIPLAAASLPIEGASEFRFFVRDGSLSDIFDYEWRIGVSAVPEPGAFASIAIIALSLLCKPLRLKQVG